MTPLLESWVREDWYAAPDEGSVVLDAVTGDPVARVSSTGLDLPGVLAHARGVGGAALRRMTFVERAALLKELGLALQARREELHELSAHTGATRADSAVDVDGGIGTLLVFASKGRKELPEGFLLVEGEAERLGKSGTFLGQHVLTPMRGAAVQINAFNFPVWAMLEKLAPAFLAGVPSIVKPATQTAYVTQHAVRILVESGLLPPGTLQLICGSPRDLLDHLGGQDLVFFTGSAATAQHLRSHPSVTGRSVRFNAEADSLNCSVLGPDATPGTPEFDLYADAVVAEMTIKAGQRCTAIRRAFVPAERLDEVTDAVTARLAEVVVGAPGAEGVTMGALASRGQRDEVLRAVKALSTAGRVVHGDPDRFEVVGADAVNGAFLPPLLLRADDVDRPEPHEVEAFGPVSTLLPYSGTDELVDLMGRGGGSLVGSVVTHDPAFAREVLLGAGAYHGRLLLLDRDDAAESTGHGTPMPQLVHGGPGRAGGGEEEGGMRAVLRHLQRTAVQGSPRLLEEVARP